jgi:hypothetical protein
MAYDRMAERVNGLASEWPSIGWPRVNGLHNILNRVRPEIKKVELLKYLRSFHYRLFRT